MAQGFGQHKSSCLSRMEEGSKSLHIIALLVPWRASDKMNSGAFAARCTFEREEGLLLNLCQRHARTYE